MKMMMMMMKTTEKIIVKAPNENPCDRSHIMNFPSLGKWKYRSNNSNHKYQIKLSRLHFHQYTAIKKPLLRAQCIYHHSQQILCKISIYEKKKKKKKGPQIS